MTRVTAPISKLTRGLTSSPSVARPAYVSNVSKASSSLAHSDAHADGRSSEHADPSRRSMTTSHRPTPPVLPSRTRVVPLMQTFNLQTSAPRHAALDSSTIDFAVLPAWGAEEVDTYASIRVPLLPDHYNPDRSAIQGHYEEAADMPLATPEISIIAAHPENVVPAALTEVEGIGIDGVELKFVHEEPAQEMDGGMMTDLWKGFVDDVFGQKKVAF